MTGPRRLRWGLPETPAPKHPYRDTLIVYASFAVIVVLIAWATGGAVRKAMIVAAIFFVIASAWSISRWRTRLRDEAERQRDGAVT